MVPLSVELGSAYISVGLGTNTLTGDIKKAFGGAEGAGKSAGAGAGRGFTAGFKGLVGAGAALVATGVFAGFIKEAAAASDATDKFKATMSFAGLNTKAIDTATKAAKAYADQTVYDLPTIQNTLAQLASNGVKDYTGLTKAAGNLNAVAGGNADTFKSVAMVMTQTAGAGKLTTENWNQLADAIPGAAGPLMKALQDAGAYTGNFRDAMAKGQITSEEFNAALGKLGSDPIAVEAAKSTKTFEGAIGNLEATINSGLMSALDRMKPAITGVINLMSGGLGKAFAVAGTASDALGSKLGPVFEQIGPLVQRGITAVGPVFASIGSYIAPLVPMFSALVPQLFQLFQALSPTSLIFQALVPVLPQIAAAIGSVLQYVLPLALSLGSQLLPIITQLISSVLPPLISIFMNVVTAIAPLITQITGLLIPVIQALMPVVVTVFSVIASVITAVMQIVQGVIQVVTGLISGNWAQVWSGIGNIFAGIWNTIVSLVSGAIRIVWSVIQAGMSMVFGFIGSILGNIGRFFADTWNNVVNGVSNMIGNVVGFISTLPGRIMGVLGGIGSWLVDSGRALIQGFIDGISGMVGAIGDAVGGILDFAGSFFPHSPAKRGPFSGKGYTTYSGKALVSDFASSIEGERAAVASAASSVMTAASLDGAVSATAGLSPSAAASQSATSAAAAGRSNQIERIVLDVGGEQVFARIVRAGERKLVRA